RCRKAVFGFETCHLSTFLIDSNKKWGRAQLLEFLNQSFKLSFRPDIAIGGIFSHIVVKKSDAAQMILSDIAFNVRTLIHTHSTETNIEHLANFYIQGNFLISLCISFTLAAGTAYQQADS